MKRKRKERTAEIEPNDKKTMRINTEKPTGTGEALKIPVAKEAQTSTKNRKLVVHPCFDEQVGQKPPAVNTNPSMEIHEVIRSLVDDCACPPCFRICIADAK